MPIGTQPYYRPPTPNTSPGGRSINPATGRIADMPGGLNFLAGFGPAPAGVQDINAAPIIHPGIVPNAGGGNQTQSYLNNLLRFWPSYSRSTAAFTNPYTHQFESPWNASHPNQAQGLSTLTDALKVYSQNPNPTDWNAIHQAVTAGAQASGASKLPSSPLASAATPAAPPTIQWGGGVPYSPTAQGKFAYHF